MSRRRPAAAGILALASACHLTPLGNSIQVGQESYVVFAGDGVEGAGDLYLVRSDGGEVFPLTYTRLEERLPALDPSGVQVAFARARRPEGAAYRVVVMNLLNGAERVLLDSVAVPTGIAWEADGTAVFVRIGDRVIRASPPPSEPDPQPVSAGEAPSADSALGTVLGDPPFAMVVPCDSAGLCLRLGDGTMHPLDPAVDEAARWGADSMAYVVGSRIEVRALGPGVLRTLNLSRAPPHPRELSVFLAGAAVARGQ